MFTGERKGLEFLKGKKVASFSGIAQPESFERSLVQLGAELVYSKRFADHHRFTQQEVFNAINRSKKRQADRDHHDAKGRGAFSENRPARPADLFHARGNQDPEGREGLPGLRAADLFPLNMDWLLYIPVMLLIKFLQALPLRVVARIGRAGGALAYWLDARHRRVALRNLEMCLGARIHERAIAWHCERKFSKAGRELCSRRQDGRHDVGETEAAPGVCRA